MGKSRGWSTVPGAADSSTKITTVPTIIFETPGKNFTSVAAIFGSEEGRVVPKITAGPIISSTPVAR